MRRFVIIILLCISFCACEGDHPEEESLMSIGIFGGSQSISANARPVKDKWAALFNARINNCGVQGAGFGSWQENNVQKQIALNMPFDVYILWCSTNDVSLNILDDSEDDPRTQSGGIKRCIDLIRQKNPNATIVLFTSIYVPNERLLKKIPAFVEKQIQICEKYDIPYLNQFDYTTLSESDFLDDKVHMSSPDGYWKLEKRQTAFLLSVIKKSKK